MFKDYPDILSVDDLCELLCIGKNIAYMLLTSKQIKATRLNHVWKIPKIAVIDYVVTTSGISIK